LYKSTKNILYRSEKILSKSSYILNLYVFCTNNSSKKKKKKYVALLPSMSILGFILSDAHFCLSYEKELLRNFCLSYEKIDYCKIRNSIIKIAISSDRNHFLSLYLCFQKFYF